MTRDSHLITAALNQRFARAGMPRCPESAWNVEVMRSVKAARVPTKGRRFAYAALLLLLVAIGSAGARAASAVRETYEHLMTPVFVSTEPLFPLIHATDRLTVAEAQRRVPFTVVEPAGLPEHTRFLYAHILSESPDPRIALTYEAHMGSKYYRVSIDESTVDSGPPVAHFNVLLLGRTLDWTVPKRRWKHGAVIMDLFDVFLPPEVGERIERANTL